jgi:hypothetical protein
MSRELKHVGRVIATGKKCLVAYRSLPGDAYNCLIVPTESLPDSYHDAMINLVESAAGQDSYELADVMARTPFPDGSIMLAALHGQRRLVKAPTDAIEMLPQLGVSIVLAELNQIIAEQQGVAVDDLAIKSNIGEKAPQLVTPKVTTPNAIKTTSESVNSVPEVPLTADEQAKKFRSDADRLSKEAASLRRQAEELAPTKVVVKPVEVPAVEVPAVEVPTVVVTSSTKKAK